MNFQEKSLTVSIAAIKSLKKSHPGLFDIIFCRLVNMLKFKSYKENLKEKMVL